MDFAFLSDASTLRIDRVLWFTAQVPLFYDYIITIDKEVEYIWPCPWSWGVTLFYMNRYIPFVELSLSSVSKFYEMSLTDCAYTSIMNFWLMILGNLVSTSIVVMRTYALWGRRKIIGYVLAFFVVSIYSVVVALLIYQSSFIFSSKNVTLMKLLSIRTICPMPTVGTQVSLHYLGLLVLVCVGELLIVSLTLAKAKDHLRDGDNSSTSWIRQLYKNGILHCVSILVLSALCMLLSVFGPRTLQFSLIPHQRVYHSIFCNRMLFLIFRQRSDLPDRSSQRVSTRLVFTSMDPLTEFSTTDEGIGRGRESWELQVNNRGWMR